MATSSGGQVLIEHPNLYFCNFPVIDDFMGADNPITIDGEEWWQPCSREGDLQPVDVDVDPGQRAVWTNRGILEGFAGEQTLIVDPIAMNQNSRRELYFGIVLGIGLTFIAEAIITWLSRPHGAVSTKR